MIQVQLNLPLYDNNGKSVKKAHRQLEVENVSYNFMVKFNFWKCFFNN